MHVFKHVYGQTYIGNLKKMCKEVVHVHQTLYSEDKCENLPHIECSKEDEEDKCEPRKPDPLSVEHFPRELETYLETQRSTTISESLVALSGIIRE